MRQRLLLVAGWVFAAVASSLVAAGAVAVAGGQVTDRPFRPLTAAEVAALPVARTVEDQPAAASPLPPAAPATAQDTSTEGAPKRGPRLGDESDSAGDEGTLEDRIDVVLDPPDPTSEVDDAADPALISDEGPSQDLPPTETPDPDLTVTLVSHTVGGSVTVTGRNGAILEFSARPRPGFAVSHEFVSASELVVFFTGGPARWMITADWDQGELSLTEIEERR